MTCQTLLFHTAIVYKEPINYSLKILNEKPTVNGNNSREKLFAFAFHIHPQMVETSKLTMMYCNTGDNLPVILSKSSAVRCNSEKRKEMFKQD